MAITLFANVTSATGAQLDVNMTAVSNQAPIPCSVTGTNTIVLAAKSNVYAVVAYTNNMQFSGVAAATNTGPATANYGALGALNIYKDLQGGPTLLSGNEIILGCAFTLLYDPALNTGIGGFHLFSATNDRGDAGQLASLQLGAGATLSLYLTTLASVTFTVWPVGTAQQQVIPLANVVPGDNVMVGAPSNHPTGVALTGLVTASGSVGLNAVNGTSVSVASIAAAYRVSVLR